MSIVKILAIAPYEGLSELMLVTAKKIEGISVDVVLGDLEDGAIIAKQAQNSGYDMIVSRGGTAVLIEEFSSIPVIAIEISDYDIICSIRLAQSHGGKFAIIGYPDITNSAKTLCTILQYNVDIFEINSPEQANSIIIKLRNTGYSIVLGDVITVSTARTLDMNAILILSGEENVAKAFIGAKKLHKNIIKRTSDLDFIKVVLDKSDGIIIVYDINKKVIYDNMGSNPFIFNCIVDKLEKNIEYIFDKGEIKQLKKHNNFLFKIHGKLIVHNGESFAAYYITQLHEASRSNKDGIVIKNPGDEKTSPINFLHMGSKYINPILERVHKISSSNIPILIRGEMGTGKDDLADMIHNNSNFKNNPMLVIDCETLTKQRWDSFVNNVNSCVYDVDHSIYLRCVHALSPQMQSELNQYISSTDLLKRHRLISSSIYDLKSLAASGDYSQRLYTKLCDLVVNLPSLSERIEDIPALSSLCINQFNIELAKCVIGFEEGAMQRLKMFKWTFNLTQLQKIIKQLVIITEGSYITNKETESVLKQTESYNSSYFNVNLRSSLEDITKEIIQLILQEENMNQTKAAQRLGISRATMWRKLK